MTHKCLSRGLLIALICAALAIPAQAQQIGGKIVNTGAIVAGIVATVAVVVVVVVVVVHESRKKTRITGCVAAGDGGMTLTNARDHRVYALSGTTADIKPGHRVTLEGKKAKTNGASGPLAWDVTKQTHDFGACQP